MKPFTIALLAVAGVLLYRRASAAPKTVAVGGTSNGYRPAQSTVGQANEPDANVTAATEWLNFDPLNAPAVAWDVAPYYTVMDAYWDNYGLDGTPPPQNVLQAVARAWGQVLGGAVGETSAVIAELKAAGMVVQPGLEFHEYPREAQAAAINWLRSLPG